MHYIIIILIAITYLLSLQEVSVANDFAMMLMKTIMVVTPVMLVINWISLKLESEKSDLQKKIRLLRFVLYFVFLSYLWQNGIIQVHWVVAVVTPVLGIFISTTAMRTGISGATLWNPYYLFLSFIPSISLSLKEAFLSSLITMLAGFSIGSFQHLKQKTYDIHYVIWGIIVSLPGFFLALFYGSWMNETMLMLFFGVTCFINGNRKHINGEHFSIGKLVFYLNLGLFLKGIISSGTEIAIPSAHKYAPNNNQKITGSFVIGLFIVNLFTIIGRLWFDPNLFYDIRNNWSNIAGITLFSFSVIEGALIGARAVKVKNSSLDNLVNKILIGIGIFILATNIVPACDYIFKGDFVPTCNNLLSIVLN